MFKYELIILALAFCALQYGRLQNDTYSSRSFLQSDRGGEEAQEASDWAESAEVKASTDETNVTPMEQFLGVSAQSSVSINGWHSGETSSKDHQFEI